MSIFGPRQEEAREDHTNRLVFLIASMVAETLAILKQMETIMSAQSDALATIVDSLTTNFATLDTEIQNLVATGSSDPAIQASIDKLSTLSAAVQKDAAQLGPAVVAVAPPATPPATA